MPIVKLKTFNYQRAKKNGFKAGLKLALLYGLIELRSKVKVWSEKEGYLVASDIVHALRDSGALVWHNGAYWYYADHTEEQFSGTYAHLSYSSTMQDGVNGCRLRNGLYSHPERWDTVPRDITPEQENKMFRAACAMADVSYDYMMWRIHRGDIQPEEVFQGPNAIRYDKGMIFAFIHQWKVWRTAKNKRHCTRAVCEIDYIGGITTELPDEQMPAQYHIGELKKALAVLPSRERTGE